MMRLSDNEDVMTASGYSNAKVRSSGVGFSHMQVLAACSVIALLSIAVWQTVQKFRDGNLASATNQANQALPEHASTPYESVDWQAGAPEAEASAAADPDGIGNIERNVVDALVGSYVALAEQGVYSEEAGVEIAEDIAETLRAHVSYKTYAADDLKTDDDTSYERMLTYRGDLRVALEPLLGNPGYELSLFANYIESKDPEYLEKLRLASQNYRAAIENAAGVVVPKDATFQHLGILNALSQFGATVEQMASHGDDAFAAAALLRTYQSSESQLMASFNTLAEYYKNRQP